MSKKISIIIVNFNSGNYLIGCLNSIKKTLRITYEVIVVDNNSSDNSFNSSRELFENLPNYKFIQSGKNLGFSKGNNLGVKFATGDFFHFLNPDTEVHDKINEDYSKVFLNPNKAYVNRLRNPNGEMMKGDHLIPTLQNYFKVIFGLGSKWYIGASIIVSKEIYYKIGGWNELFWMYYEDTDFCYKLASNGIKIEALPSIIEHIGGGCSSNVWSNQKRLNVVKEAELLFYKTNRISYQYRIVKLIHYIYNLVHRWIK